MPGFCISNLLILCFSKNDNRSRHQTAVAYSGESPGELQRHDEVGSDHHVSDTAATPSQTGKVFSCENSKTVVRGITNIEYCVQKGSFGFDIDIDHSSVFLVLILSLYKYVASVSFKMFFFST